MKSVKTERSMESVTDSFQGESCQVKGENNEMDRAIVDVEPLWEAIKKIREFNQLDLATVDLREAGGSIPMTPELLRAFEFTGLSNIDFVKFEVWKDPDFIRQAFTE